METHVFFCMVTTSWIDKVLPSLTEQDHYPYLLGISSDTLVVINSNEELVETLILGKDNEGLLCCLQDEDSFLEAISEISKVIKRGLNPLEYFNLVQ